MRKPHARRRRELADRAGKKCAACGRQAERRGRVPSRNGDWPTAAAPPGAPALGFLIRDVNDLRAPAPVFGQYPANLIDHVLPILRCARHEILHVCSGSLRPGEGVRVDLRRKQAPDVVADGRALPCSSSFAAVMLDPPYTEQYAADLYGVDYPRPSHLLREAARVVRPGGRIAFVHYITPNPPSGCFYLASFGLSVGYGFPMRALTIFEREQPSLLERAQRET